MRNSRSCTTNIHTRKLLGLPSTGAVLVGKAEPAPLGKIPGEKYLLESDGGLMHVEGRTYLIGKRLFFLQAQRPKNSPAPQSEFDTFFASFVPAKK